MSEESGTSEPEEPAVLFFTPKEAAKQLGLSVEMLGYYRRTGRIKGIWTGNSTLYTQMQIDNADLTKYKAGRPPTRKLVKEAEDEKDIA